jgi:hypothetical protein
MEQQNVQSAEAAARTMGAGRLFFLFRASGFLTEQRARTTWFFLTHENQSGLVENRVEEEHQIEDTTAIDVQESKIKIESDTDRQLIGIDYFGSGLD